MSEGGPRGLRPYTRAGRARVADALLPLWREKFGRNLLAVAADGSFARGDDGAYSDLELVVFLREAPGPGEDRYLQRVVDGMKVEALYVTEAEYLASWRTLSPDWFIAGSSRLAPLHAPAEVERISRAALAVRHPRHLFLARAAHRLLEVQEAFAKVLTAVERGSAEGLGLLLWDGVLHTLVVLSFLNERPYTTLATFVSEARLLPRTPPRLDELLDLVERGGPAEPDHLRELLPAVLAGLEEMFAAEGMEPYDENPDPRVPNRRGDGGAGADPAPETTG